MIHNHEVPSSILGLATDLEAPVAVWLRVLFFCARRGSLLKKRKNRIFVL